MYLFSFFAHGSPIFLKFFICMKNLILNSKWRPLFSFHIGIEYIFREHIIIEAKSQ